MYESSTRCVSWIDMLLIKNGTPTLSKRYFARSELEHGIQCDSSYPVCRHLYEKAYVAFLSNTTLRFDRSGLLLYALHSKSTCTCPSSEEAIFSSMPVRILVPLATISRAAQKARFRNLIAVLIEYICNHEL